MDLPGAGKLLEGGDMMMLCMSFRHEARAMETFIEETDLPLQDWCPSTVQSVLLHRARIEWGEGSSGRAIHGDNSFFLRSRLSLSMVLFRENWIMMPESRKRKVCKCFDLLSTLRPAIPAPSSCLGPL